jgi:DNA-binding response OmpR family regulator
MDLAAERDDDEVIRAGWLEIRPDEALALAGGRPLVLSMRELALLTALARHQDRIVGREQLYRLVWGGEMRPGDRSVDVYVRKLRVKLEQGLPEWRFIHTHFGFGYRFTPELSQLLHTRATAT